MSKYEPLKAFLAQRTEPVVRLRFADIEDILGFALPKSAVRYDEWWSNNTAGHSHARAWVEAGWLKDKVDRSNRMVAFRRVQPPSVPKLARSDVFGRLKGSIAVRPGVDLTEPTGEVWNAERGIVHE